MLVKSNLHQLRRGKVNQGSTLFIIGEFQQLLAKVVTEGIYSRRKVSRHRRIKGRIKVIPVMSSMTCMYVSLKISCTCSGLRSSNLRCKYRQPCWSLHKLYSSPL